MRVIFAGTPEFAAKALVAVADSHHTVQAVLTQPDRPAGRGMKLLPSPVKKFALSRGFPVLQPATLKDDPVQQTLREFDADVLVVAAYGLLLPQAVLDIPRFGAINLHASLLPRWRGAAPIQRAILAGDRETGICIMRMDVGLDTGPVLKAERLAIADTDTAGSLLDRLSSMGARMIVSELDAIELIGQNAIPQSSNGATYAKKLEKVEAQISWEKSADEIWRQIRAFDPVPGASTTFRGESLKLFRAERVPGAGGASGEVAAADSDGIVIACGAGSVRISELQRAGGRRLPVVEFLRGIQIAEGDTFGS